MDKRKAKREACWIASLLLQGYLDEGYDESSPRTEAEEEKIEAAIMELRNELARRGWRDPEDVPSYGQVP